MKGVIVLSIFLIFVISFSIHSAEGRGHGKRRHHHREPSSSESSSESYEEIRRYGRSETDAEPPAQGPTGRGWFESLKDAAYDLGNIALDKAKSTDWKEVGSIAWDKAQKMGAAAMTRKKRSDEVQSAEILIAEQQHFEDLALA